MIATTARDITFRYQPHGSTLVTDIRNIPAGTEVHAITRRNRLVLRMPGTLLEATVPANAVTIP